MVERDEERIATDLCGCSSRVFSFLSHYWLALLLIVFIFVDKSGLIALDGANLLRSYPDLARHTSTVVCRADFLPPITVSKWSWLNLLPIDGLSGIPDTPTLIPFRRLAESASKASNASSGDAGTSNTSSASSDSSSGGHDGHHEGPQDALFFLVGCLLVGTGVTQLSSWPIFHGVQNTVVLFVLGVCTALLLESLGIDKKIGVFGRSYDMWVYIDPHLLLFTMLPPLVTGDAMTIDTNVAKRVFLQCLYLAGPGVALCGMTTAFFLWFYLPYDWPFLLCLTAGSILCATDPVAVVALLKELGAAPALTVQIQGESLLNDGTAIVLYTIAYNMLGGKHYDVGDIVVFLVKMAIYAWGLGLAIGYVFFCWIRATNNKLHHHSAVVQIALTVCCAYSSFIIAEGLFHISGVLSTVAAAFVLAHKMWPEIADVESMHTVWHMLEYLMNTLIFFLSGCLSGHVMLSPSIKGVDYLHLLVIYIVITIIRGALFFSSRPLLRILHTDRQEVTLAEAAVMTWGGLRGAIGLALAIQVARDRAGDSISQRDADHVLFFVSGIAALTLIVNATTCPMLVKRLGITAMGSTKRKMLQMIARQLRDIVRNNTRHGRVRDSLNFILDEVDHEIAHPKSRLKMLQDAAHTQRRRLRQTMNTTGKHTPSERHTEMRRHTMSVSGEEVGMLQSATSKLDVDGTKSLNFLGSVFETDHKERQTNEEVIDEYEMMKADYKELVKTSKNRGALQKKMPLKDQEKKIIEMLQKPESERTMDSDVLRAVNEAMLSLVLTQYWTFTYNGEFFGSEAEQVFASIINAFAWHYDLVDFSYIEPFVETPFAESHGRMSMAGKRVPGKSKPKLTQKATASRTRVHHDQTALHLFLQSPAFNAALASVIVGSAILTTIEQEVRNDDSSRGEAVWLAFELFFTCIFFAEFILKVLDEKLDYFRSSMKLFELLLVILGIVGCVLGFIGLGDSSSRGVRKSVTQIGVVFRMLRIARIFRLRKLWRNLKGRLTKKTQVEEVSEHMKKSAILKAFIKAHMNAQKQLVEYFGHHGKVTRLEVARIILQSQSQVYKAITMMGNLRNNSDEHGTLVELLQQKVRYADLSREMTDKCEHFVLSVYEHGVLTSSETDSMLEPLHHRIEKIIRDLRDYHHGRIDENDMEEIPRDSTVSDCLHSEYSDGEHSNPGSDASNDSGRIPATSEDLQHVKKDTLIIDDSFSSGPGKLSPELVGKPSSPRLSEPNEEPAPECDQDAQKKGRIIRPATKKKPAEVAMRPLLHSTSDESVSQASVERTQSKPKAKKRLRPGNASIRFADGV